MTFNPNKNLSDQIADYLIEKVISLEIGPGERILEQKISKELGVSRSPVREALRILEQTGLVDLIPRCGARVAYVTEERVMAYCDIFSLLLGHVTRRCIEKCTDDHVKRLTAQYNEMAACADKGDHKGYYNALLNCIEVGIEATGNQALEQVVRSIMPNLKRLQYIAIILKINSLKDNFNYFKPLLKALKNRDVEKGGKIIESYIENEIKNTLDIVNNSDLSKIIAQK